MTFLSRCELPAVAEPARRRAPSRPASAAEAGGFRRALLGFAEDLGILVRYAAGLDYYDRAALSRRAGTKPGNGAPRV